MVCRAGLPNPDNCLDVPCLADRGLGHHLTSMKLCPLLTNELTEADSRSTKACHLEENVSAIDRDSEALCVTWVGIHE